MRGGIKVLVREKKPVPKDKSPKEEQEAFEKAYQAAKKAAKEEMEFLEGADLGEEGSLTEEKLTKTFVRSFMELFTKREKDADDQNKGRTP